MRVGRAKQSAAGGFRDLKNDSKPNLCNVHVLVYMVKFEFLLPGTICASLATDGVVLRSNLKKHDFVVWIESGGGRRWQFIGPWSNVCCSLHSTNNVDNETYPKDHQTFSYFLTLMCLCFFVQAFFFLATSRALRNANP